MTLLRHLPNALTTCNLLCGCVGIVFAFQNPMVAPAYFVWLCCVFDFFDGFAARLLKVGSPIGKQLDSLADMVSFGLLPAVVMFQWIKGVSGNQYLPYVAFLLAAFSALRLAKFNIDENQKDSFIGLPTPANALFITSLIFLKEPFNVITSPLALVSLTVFFSFLLVAPVELFALKFNTYRWADNKLRFTFLGLSVLLLILIKAIAIPFIILLYVFASLTSKVFSK